MTALKTDAPDQATETRKFLVLLLGSIGVVYGDIGTRCMRFAKHFVRFLPMASIIRKLSASSRL